MTCFFLKNEGCGQYKEAGKTTIFLVVSSKKTFSLYTTKMADFLSSISCYNTDDFMIFESFSGYLINFSGLKVVDEGLAVFKISFQAKF